MTIGILAVQGAFIEHAKVLEKLGVSSIELRKASDLENHIDGLILPVEKVQFRENFSGNLECMIF